MIKNYKISIIVPVYNVGKSIIDFIGSIPNYVDQIIVVDDKCPLGTGKILKKHSQNNEKLEILFNDQNLGVGGTVKRGYESAIKKNSDIIVKIDGDGQMDSDQIIRLVNCIVDGYDYSKGNRFLNTSYIKNYPLERFLGNKFLSLYSKFSTGYWDIFDPINGFTAIKKNKLKELNLDKVDNRYFFETDMLFNLYLLKSTVKDVSVNIKYFKDHRQNLNILKETFNFFFKNFHRLLNRVRITYLNNSVRLPGILFSVGISSLLFSVFFGSYNLFIYSMIKKTFIPNSINAICLISFIVGLFTLLFFFKIDINNNPNKKK
jgi:dolichol-phosphate mannosyltransferase